MAITLPQLLAFSSFSVILGVGQLLFKGAALRNPELTGIAALSHLLQDYLFWLYGAATFLLVYILQQVPLSHVYPVTTALAFVLVPLGAGRRIRGYAPAAFSSGHTVHRRRHRLVRARAAMSWGRRWSKRP